MKYTCWFVSAMMLIIQACQLNKPVNPDKDTKVPKHGKAYDSFMVTLTPPMDPMLRNALIDSAIKFGDKEMFSKVVNGEPFMGPELLFPALTMANKYNDEEACYDIYIILRQEGWSYINLDSKNIDNKTKTIGMYYLLRSYEMGYEEAKATIDEMFVYKHLPVPKSGDYLVFK